MNSAKADASNWRSSVDIIQEFYGEPLTRDLVSLIAATPPEQIIELLDRLRYPDPSRNFSQSTRTIPVAQAQQLAVMLEAAPHFRSIRDLRGLAPLLLLSDVAAITDPLWRFRVRSGTSAKLPRQTPVTGPEIAAACLDLVPLQRLATDGLIVLTPQAHIGTTEFNLQALFDDPVASLAVPLEPWLEMAEAQGIQNPSRWAAILAWESLMGSSDHWNQAAARILKAGEPTDLAQVLATSQVARDADFDVLYSSSHGRDFVEFGHQQLTGSPDVINLGVPFFDVQMEDAISLRGDYEVFHLFREGLLRTMTSVAMHGDLNDDPRTFARYLMASARDELAGATSELERLRRKNRVIAALVPRLAGGAIGAAIGAATFGAAGTAGSAAGRAAGNRAVRKRRTRAESSDVAHRLVVNLVELGRL